MKDESIIWTSVILDYSEARRRSCFPLTESQYVGKRTATRSVKLKKPPKKLDSVKAGKGVSNMTHVFQVDHKGDVAPDGGVELALAGGQAEATWRPRSTRLSVGRKDPPASLLTVVGQNLSVP